MGEAVSGDRDAVQAAVVIWDSGRCGTGTVWRDRFHLRCSSEFGRMGSSRIADVPVCNRRRWYALCATGKVWKRSRRLWGQGEWFWGSVSVVQRACFPAT